MDLDLRDLVFFLAVEREGSFGRAATDLVVTQPAVSERIRHLERVVGSTLFERTPRGVVLTLSGTALLPYAQRCVALAEETVEAARRAEGTPALVVAVHSAHAQRIVPFVLGTLTDLPRRVTIRDAHSEVVPALLIDGVADLGFALTASAPRGLQRTPLRPDPMLCVAAPDHPITNLRRPTPAALSDSLIALLPWGDGFERFLGRLHAAGVDEWRVRYCGDAATAVALASEHHHVGLVTHSAAIEALRQNRLRSVRMTGVSSWQVHLNLLHRRADRGDAVVQAIVGAIDAA